MLTEPELEALLEDRLGERRPGLLADLARHHLVEPQRSGTYLIPSPGLLRLALDLETAGIDLEVTAGATARLRKHLGRAATELADRLLEELGTKPANDEGVPLTEALRRLRPVAPEWVRLFSRARWSRPCAPASSRARPRRPASVAASDEAESGARSEFRVRSGPTRHAADGRVGVGAGMCGRVWQQR